MLRYVLSKRREAFGEVLDKGVSARHDASTGQGLEAAHGSESLLEVPVVPFQPVIQVPRGAMLGAG